MAITVEAYKPYIEELLRHEPWRAGPSQGDELCPGAFDWDGSHLWCCHACGRIGSSAAPLHHPVRHPTEAVQEKIRQFIAAFFSTARRLAQAA